MISSQIIRGMSTSARMSLIKKLVVIGGGSMGTRIAQVSAATGHNVTLCDISDDVLTKSKASIAESLQQVAAKKFADDAEKGKSFVSDVMSRIQTSTDTKSSVQDVDLVLEAIVEELKIKQDLFKELDAIAPQHTIFATNTLSLSVRDIAAVTNRQDRFGGVRFFYPVPMTELVKIIKARNTSLDTLDSLSNWGKALGMTVELHDENKIYVVNHLIDKYLLYLLAAVRLHERGDVSIEDIDIAMKQGADDSMGAFRSLDYMGLDDIKFIIAMYHEVYPENPSFYPSPLLDKLVAEGKLGVKSGEGFCKYGNK